MRFDPKKHHRRSIRLKGYDYAQAGAYFVTICTQNRALFFENEAIRRIAERCWLEIPRHVPTVELDAWVVMPNHMHGIIVMNCRGVQLNAPTKPAKPTIPTGIAKTDVRTGTDKSNNPTQKINHWFSIMSPHRNALAVIIRTYKAAVTTLCRREDFADFAWQRNYHEHIIRNEDELNRIRQYIAENPLKWETDRENLAAQTAGSEEPWPV